MSLVKIVQVIDTHQCLSGCERAWIGSLGKVGLTKQKIQTSTELRDNGTLATSHATTTEGVTSPSRQGTSPRRSLPLALAATRSKECTFCCTLYSKRSIRSRLSCLLSLHTLQLSWLHHSPSRLPPTLEASCSDTVSCD